MTELLYMEVNLRQLKENIKNIKSTSNKDVIVVIKSNAYCLGDIEIAKYLEDSGIRFFAVVDLDEALKLCKSGIKSNIIILNSLRTNDFKYLEDYPNLIVSINNISDCMNLVNNYKLPINVHMQVETGMSRAGFKTVEDLKQALDILNEYKIFNIQGIYTHITQFSSLNKQEEKFEKFIRVYNFPMVHLAASNTYKHTKIGNFVRVGLDIYGDCSLNANQQIITIKAKPISINEISKGETIGYDETYTAESDLKIAVLPIGYYNGFRRALKGFYVIANGKKYQIVGNICMNHIFILIDDDVNIDTEFTITSSQLPVNEIARYINTISHEVLCMFNIPNKHYIK